MYSAKSETSAEEENNCPLLLPDMTAHSISFIYLVCQDLFHAALGQRRLIEPYVFTKQQKLEPG